MTCFHPNQGYENRYMTKNGKYQFTSCLYLARRNIFSGKPIKMTTPCHKCEGCRYDYSREWTTKIVHESLMHKENSFITLTYNDEFLPLYGALDYKGDWDDFLQRLRDALYPRLIRYYMCGEYGEKNLRPHYHAIIFGYDFPDKYEYSDRFGCKLYRSPFLEKLWSEPRGRLKEGMSLGFSTVGTVTTASAAYVARYGMKKIGNYLDKRYQRLDLLTGEVVDVPRERTLMSRRPGIGRSWFEKYAKSDLYNKGYVHLPNGTAVPPPKYYDKLMEKVDPSLIENLKKSRQDYMSRHVDHFTPAALAAKKEYFLNRIKTLKRCL